MFVVNISDRIFRSFWITCPLLFAVKLLYSIAVFPLVFWWCRLGGSNWKNGIRSDKPCISSHQRCSIGGPGL